MVRPLVLLGATVLAAGALVAWRVPDWTGEDGFCGDRSGFIRVDVIRHDGLNHPRFTFPARVAVTDPASVRRMADAVCGLPRVKPGTAWSCPADFGRAYTLRFSGPENRRHDVVAKADGCQDVSGAGDARRVGMSPFWEELGAAMRLPGATIETFQGRTD